MDNPDLTADELKALAGLAILRLQEPACRFDGSGWTAMNNNAWCDLLKRALEYQGYIVTYRSTLDQMIGRIDGL